jgi:poly-gamma-glutamate synthesis protein (capsule biosynthesis protein)
MENSNIKILIAGDFVPPENVHQLNFKDLCGIIELSDFSLLNLEAPITNTTNSIKKLGSLHKGQPQSVSIIKDTGFNAVCLANNHIMDYGLTGLLDTIQVCHDNSLLIVGAGNVESYNRPLIVENNHTKICILNYCENEFSSAKLHGYGANPLDIVSNYYDIVKAKQTADIVIVIIHGGREYHHFPLPYFKRICEFYIDAGADAIVGHHPHYFGGYTYYKGKPIFFSLGNLYMNSNRNDAKQNISYVLILNFRNQSITHNIVGIKKDDSLLRLMNMTEQNQLLEQIYSINEIINDNEKLVNYWDSQKKEFDYYLRIFRFRNKWLYKIFKRLPVLPLKPFNSYSLIMQNLIQCESHRELFLRTLINLNQPFERE